MQEIFYFAREIVVEKKPAPKKLRREKGHRKSETVQAQLMSPSRTLNKLLKNYKVSCYGLPIRLKYIVITCARIDSIKNVFLVSV